MPVVLFIMVVLGIMFGTQVDWPWQVAAVFAFYTIMESPMVRSMELGAIIPMVLGVYFLGGMLIGDISWFIQVGHESMHWSMVNPFVAK